MSRDSFHSLLLRAQGVVIGAAVTTRTCAHAQELHDLSSTACIALGRLLTATALVGSVQRRHGLLSFQMVGRGKLRQLFADMTHDGHLRGYARNPHIGFPLAPDEDPSLRISIGHGLAPGSCSMIREPENANFVQSTTDLVDGEIDTDVEAAVRRSDQIVTGLACEVLLDERVRVRHAAGVILQILPHGDAATLETLSAALHNGGLAKRLLAHKGDILAVVRELAPEAEPVEEPTTIHWQCRCSIERVRSALQMLSAHDLTEMIAKGSPVEVTCDFCRTVYTVGVEDMRTAHATLIQTQN